MSFRGFITSWKLSAEFFAYVYLYILVDSVHSSHKFL